MNIDPYPDTPAVSSIDENRRLMQEAADRLSAEDRCAMLEAAILHHRMAVGQAYGIGSFKTQHAANVELWAHVRSAFVTASTKNDESADEAGLARPAMMEDDE
jgi:hypothetical protein